MSSQMIVADPAVRYEPKEAAVMVAALAWVIGLTSVSLAALIICGWRGAKSVALDWLKMRATFNCR